ncbi:hypothetical protein FG05_35316 [Fusarium graminearum]|nr:hypothetical protein FG05_35316 [Fusarium graminearum]
MHAVGLAGSRKKGWMNYLENTM